MKAVVAAFNQEKALVGAFSVIVQPVVEPMDRFTALDFTVCSVQVSYYSGGSGYVLSRGAFTRLMREGLLLPGPRRCAMPHTRAEGISNYPPEWYSINEDVQVSIYS